MVNGLGMDLVEVERIADAIERFGQRFLERIFTEAERRYCAVKRAPAESLAARFAAKEAAAKALGTGISRGIRWRDIEVTREAGCAPELALHGRALALASSLGVTRSSVSLTHTSHYAAAVVVLERSS